MSLPRIILADDHPAFLEQVRLLLSEEFDIVAAVDNGEATVEAVTHLQPDVAILDISMPRLSGLEALARLHTAGDRTPIVILTMHEGPEFQSAARTAGATGYVIKRQVGTHLLRAIQAVIEGRAITADAPSDGR